MSADFQSGPARELTQRERFIWGMCPVCKAVHGEPCHAEPCHAEVGMQLGAKLDGSRMQTGEGVHLARLQRAPYSVREVPA